MKLSKSERNYIMPKECAICKRPAVLAARITRGEQTATAFLCENCTRRVGKKFLVEIVDSAIVSMPKGLIIDPFEPKQEDVVCYNTNNYIIQEEAEKPLQEMNSELKIMFCDICGKKLAGDIIYCPYCGRKISDAYLEGNDEHSQTLPISSDGSKDCASVTLPNKKTIGIFLICVSIVFIVIGAFQVLSPTYRNNVDFYNTCIENKMDLGVGSFYNNISRTYDEWIVEYGEKIQSSRIKAVAFALIGFTCGALGIFFVRKTNVNVGVGTTVSPIKKQARGKRVIIRVLVIIIPLSLAFTCLIIYYNSMHVFQRAFEKAGGKNNIGEWVTVSGDGKSLRIDTNPADEDDFYDSGATKAIRKINKELDLPDSLYEKMTETRALDGRQNWTNNRITVSWTYHPDQGLEIIYERK